MQEDRPPRPAKRDARKERRLNNKKLGQATETSEPEIELSDNLVAVPESASQIANTTPTLRPVGKTGRSPASSWRASLAVVSGRTAGALSRRLHLGGGTSIAGVVAQRLYPDIVEHLSQQLQQGSILVTGTNGKTTTSGFIASVLRAARLRVWRNREGSNLMRGIAGALVIRTLPNGKLRRSGQAISIFEVDEAVMPQAVQTLPARVVVFTNLFRDQLDRYGEVDSVLERWKRTISALSSETILVLNADDPTIASLGDYFAGRIIYFGIEDSTLDLETHEGNADRHQVVDTHTCSKCGSEYSYSLRFYSHIGHYTCPACGRSRPSAEVRATKVENDSFDCLRMQVETPAQQGEIVVPLPGLYNIYNALAAIATAQALNLSWTAIVSGIEQFKPAFGRGERIQIEGRTIRMLLAKNPTGFNEVLRTLFSDGNKRHVLFVLNDNIADGKDISWIWDVDFEQAINGLATLTVAGTRARDLALRLKYAGIDSHTIVSVPPGPLRAEKNNLAVSRSRRNVARRLAPGKRLSARQTLPETSEAVEPSQATQKTYGIAQALDRALRLTPENETLFIVPTYTGLLEIHRELERRGLTPHYWEETGP
ncbi:MAG TPA: MurT ligase domain-containing protein [Ktedonobacteraceae bacterium]|nr:MurT ligase domain-containing protein [Ktedonobacteraceae bacterium]